MAAIRNQTCDKSGKPYLCDPKQQALVTRIDTEFDAKKRLSMIHELIALQHDEAVNLFLFQGSDMFAVKNRVQGFRSLNRTIQWHEAHLAR